MVLSKPPEHSKAVCAVWLNGPHPGRVVLRAGDDHAVVVGEGHAVDGGRVVRQGLLDPRVLVQGGLTGAHFCTKSELWRCSNWPNTKTWKQTKKFSVIFSVQWFPQKFRTAIRQNCISFFCQLSSCLHERKSFSPYLQCNPLKRYAVIGVGPTILHIIWLLAPLRELIKFSHPKSFLLIRNGVYWASEIWKYLAGIIYPKSLLFANEIHFFYENKLFLTYQVYFACQQKRQIVILEQIVFFRCVFNLFRLSFSFGRKQTFHLSFFSQLPEHFGLAGFSDNLPGKKGAGWFGKLKQRHVKKTSDVLSTYSDLHK